MQIINFNTPAAQSPVKNFMALLMRLSIAPIFFISGRTKVDGLLEVNENALFLFAQDYKLPGVDPVWAAHLATYAEHLLPVLLVFGLFTRFSALGLLGMTIVIQCLVYPDAWPTHLSWCGILLCSVVYGPGRWSLDHYLGTDCNTRLYCKASAT